MKWNLLEKGLAASGKGRDSGEIVDILLSNRGIKTKKDREEFLNPPSPSLLAPSALGIDSKQLGKAINRIHEAIDKKEPIVVYGDYDVDGICSTAILWETLRDLGASAMPFIPGREKEGYGLSVEGIKAIFEDPKYGLDEKSKSKRGLLITVDNGIVAHDAVKFANKSGLEVIIIDHHEIAETLPDAFAIVHTLELCAAGITYVFCKSLRGSQSDRGNPSQEPIASPSVRNDEERDDKLELAAIATVADLVPLVGANRSIVKFGLDALSQTRRPGIQALCEVAGIKKIGTYEIGYLIAPRINASGRIDSALVGLRLLCTKDFKRANEFATQLNEINKERQGMVEEMVAHALSNYELRITNDKLQTRIIVIEHESYHQGVIGLIAGKLVERYYLPAIVISKGETTSKASARSISGFNIIEAIRDSNEFLINAGGHPMAAGFSINTDQITNFKLRITNFAGEKITKDLLEKSLKVDLGIQLEQIGMQLYEDIVALSPYGIGNPEPVFSSEVKVESIRTMGADGKHLKLTVGQPELVSGSQTLEAVGFGMGKMAANLQPGDKIEIAYNLSINDYLGSRTLQLKLKDIKNGRTDPES